MNSNKYIFKNRISQHLDILHWVMGLLHGVCVGWRRQGGWVKGAHLYYTVLPGVMGSLYLSMRAPSLTNRLRSCLSAL